MQNTNKYSSNFLNLFIIMASIHFEVSFIRRVLDSTRKHPILGYHLSGERWRALAKKLCHKINDFYW